ncbi:MAG: type III pantothenate kinase [Candidatus Margulisiibacteriota bacterium]|jgi:type III pantothenate kinase
MDQILTIDVGNTSIHWGIFRNGDLFKQGKVLTKEVQNLPILGKDLSRVMVSSVVPAADQPLRSLYPKAEFVTAKNLPYLKVQTKHPAQVGADRLVNAVAVYELYGAPALIIDFGTATTFCALTKDGTYLGGAIAPGIDLSRLSLHQHTAKLPLVSFAKPTKVIGSDTEQAMRSGLFYGYIGLVEGMIERMRPVIGKKVKVIATGGYAKMICAHIPQVDRIDELLTLKGLLIIAKANKI